MFNRIQCAILIIGMLSVSLLPGSTVSAQSYQPKINVGFASMQSYSFESRAWNARFMMLARQGYWMKYSSAAQVAEKLQVEKLLHPFTLEIPGDMPILPTNTHAVQKFHEEFLVGNDRYLRNLALANQAALIVFDYMEEFEVEGFVHGQAEVFTLHIFVYYLDSNAIAMEHIEINRNEFNETRIDYNSLKSKTHQAILDSLENAIINTAGFMSNNARDSRTTAADLPNVSDNRGQEGSTFWD